MEYFFGTMSCATHNFGIDLWKQSMKGSEMAENVTNELILEHLKAIQAKVSRTDERLEHIEGDIRIIKGHMASFMQAEVQQDTSIASLQARLDRIERRLDLSDSSN